ncbi:MAG: hypothetical protein L3K18_09605 [Thermoplasmata archaeon]|nr:hypothetical protein [Thermoplasmata archaeon]
MLIAVDCDGTVDVSGGPVPLELLKKLSERHTLFIIGNPWLAQHLPGIVPDQVGGKSATLKRWKAERPKHDRYIVVDDMPHQYEQGWEGWEFFTPVQFVEAFG